MAQKHCREFQRTDGRIVVIRESGLTIIELELDNERSLSHVHVR